MIDALRQPLEDRVIHISRAKGTAQFPANFILITAMNPCPCGNYGFRGKECTCSAIQLQRYQQKISGPILERIDIWLEVPRIEHEKLVDTGNVSERADVIKDRVKTAREIQTRRFKGCNRTNASMSARDIINTLQITEDAKRILNDSAQKLILSPRVYHKIIKVVQTIADLAGSSTIDTPHILEAVQYRPKKQ